MRAGIIVGLLGIVLLSVGCASRQPAVRVIPGEQMRIDAEGATARRIPGGWELTLPMQNDNNGVNGEPAGFRQWWHFEASGFHPRGERLVVNIANARYRESMMPVASINGAPYTRLPGMTRPERPEGTNDLWTFSYDVPPGTRSLKIARWFPYTMAMFDEFRAWYNDPILEDIVEEEVIGYSEQGRPIYLVTVTDRSVPDDDKQRVWVHTAVHPAETTAYFVTEGLMRFLVSGDPYARTLLRGVIFNIVPMVNPDGVWVGNYRTNAKGVNLEDEYYAPYQSTVAESAAMRRKIEEFMGTEEQVGSNPIRILLNLHAAPGPDYPFHYVHPGTWFQPGDPGAKPSINALELHWIELFKARCPYLAKSDYTRTSTFERSSNPDVPRRPFIEAMMHDRYSIKDQWEDVLAICFEGSYYEKGPIDGVPAVPDDYRTAGWQMGQTIGDFLGIPAPAR
ncbi:MAG: hypothetical protein KF858_08370 [Candidatus Sumerlaeia bacterium]|nr:hypothetical protein [Candidatus Sumerlaeia bacterium]